MLLGELKHLKDSGKINVDGILYVKDLFESYGNFVDHHFRKNFGMHETFSRVKIVDARRVRLEFLRENGNTHNITVNRLIEKLSLGAWNVERDEIVRKKTARVPITFTS